MDNKELELAHDLLTAEEEIRLTKAVQAKGTDCDEMKKLQEVYGNFVASVAKEYLNNGLSLCKGGYEIRPFSRLQVYLLRRLVDPRVYFVCYSG